jgi:putative NADPH-quinone reductase
MPRSRNILIIDGHPDTNPQRFLHALAAGYAGGARAGGHAVRLINVGELDPQTLRSGEEFTTGSPSAALQKCQEDVAWAQHIVILFPLWLGDMPGQLKIFLEQVLRPGFAFAAAKGKGLPRRLLRGRTARIVVTMGMPAFFYRWYFRAHSVKNLQRNILAFCGIEPARVTLVGMVEGMSDKQRQAWLHKLAKFGGEGR